MFLLSLSTATLVGVALLVPPPVVTAPSGSSATSGSVLPASTATPPADATRDKPVAPSVQPKPPGRPATPARPGRVVDGSKTIRTPPVGAAARSPVGSVLTLSRDDASKPLTAEQTAALVAVANDISPEWAAWIRERSEHNPQGLRAAIQDHGRRLVALAVLREQSPDLYELKVAELRLQAEVGDAAKRYREALAAGRADEAERLFGELRAKAAQQVDKSLKARAAELKALDEQMKAIDQKVRSFREELMEDTRNRDTRIDELLKGVTSGGTIGSITPPPVESKKPDEATR